MLIGSDDVRARLGCSGMLWDVPGCSRVSLCLLAVGLSHQEWLGFLKQIESLPGSQCGWDSPGFSKILQDSRRLSDRQSLADLEGVQESQRISKNPKESQRISKNLKESQ